MRELDEQERLIVRHLIRDPRESDNGIGEATGVNVRTVGRKRQKLEQAGILSYFTHLDLSTRGTGQFGARHLYISQFKIGVTYKQVLEDIQREPSVRSVFVLMFCGTSGRVKLGHPVPESYLSRELKSGSPETTST